MSLTLDVADAFFLPESENFPCETRNECATDAHRHPAAQNGAFRGVQRNPVTLNEFSSKMTGWGGPRVNSGGPRANSGGARPNSGPKPKPAVEPQRAIQLRPLGPRWYVLHLAFGSEMRVMRDIVEGEQRTGYPFRPGYQAEMPMQAVRRYRRGLPVIEQVPMMRGYAFCRFVANEDDWQAIAHIDGVIRVFTTKSLTPIPLPEDGMIERLIATAAERLSLKAPAMPQRLPGTLLRVVDGAFEGFPAVTVECDGLTTTATVGVFGREVPVTMAWDKFAAADVQSERA